MPRRLAVVAAAAVLVALTACSDDPNVTPTTTEAAIAPTTSVAPRPTTSARAPLTSVVAATTVTTTAPIVPVTTTAIPLPTSESPTETTVLQNATGIDWLPVLQDIYDRRFALFVSPDPALVATVTLPGSEAYDRLIVEVEELVQRGWHFEGEPAGQVVAAREEYVDDPSAPTVVTLTITLEPTGSGEGRMVDANGQVVQEVALDPSVDRLSVGLVRETTESSWRLGNEVRLAPSTVGG